jgi:N-hydroxyarylamine O-acetyltransferase
MVLKVPADREIWLADVGFGGVGLLEPIALRDGTVAEQAGLTYTLRREGCLWILSMRDPAKADDEPADGAAPTMDLYEFSEDPQTAGDVEVANHFTSTHPDSVFRRTLTIQRSTRDGRVILRGDTLTRYKDGRALEESIARERIREIARELFGVELPQGPLISEIEQQT